MSRIEVRKGEKEGQFRVLVNYIQEGSTLHSPVLANALALQLQLRFYPTAIVVLFQKTEKTEKTEKTS